MRFMQATAQSLHAPAGYVSDVLDNGAWGSRQAEGK
jgi:multicomponent K+:H+ antiporter subunit D